MNFYLIIFVFFHQMNIQGSKYDYQQAYATLLHQYHRDEAQIFNSEKQVSKLQQKILHSPPSAQFKIRQSIKSIIDCDPITKQEMITEEYEEQVCRLLEKISESILKQCKEGEHKQQIQNNLKSEINSLQDKLKCYKKEQEQGIIREQSENDIDKRIQQIQINIINFQSLIETKKLNPPTQAAKIFEELQEYEKLEHKLKSELNLKIDEENIQKQKLVIQYGKLNKLENEYSQKQGKHLSLLKHYEHIQQRCSLSKKEKANFTDKTINCPAPDQIASYQQENKALESELKKQSQGLKQYIKTKSEQITEDALQEKRRKLKQLQTSEKELLEEQNLNFRLKRDYSKFKQQVRVLKEYQKQQIQVKNMKCRARRSEIEKYKREQEELQKKIEGLHNAFRDFNLRTTSKR